MATQTNPTRTWTLTTPNGQDLGTITTGAALPTNGPKEQRNIECLKSEKLVAALVAGISKQVGYTVRISRIIPTGTGLIYVTYGKAGDAQSPVKVTARTKAEAQARQVEPPKVARPAQPATKPAATKTTKPAVTVRTARAPKTTRTLNTNERGLVTRLTNLGYTEREAIAIVTAKRS